MTPAPVRPRLSPLLLAIVFRLPRRRVQYGAIAALALLPTLFRWMTAATSGPMDYETYFAVVRSPFHLTFDGLAVGMLCALIHRDRDALAWTASRRLAGALFWIGAGVVLALLVPQPLLAVIGLFDVLFLQTTLAIGCGLVLLGLVLGGGPGGWFRGRAMLVVSRLAYCLYLVHYALVPGVRAMLAAAPGFDGLSPAGQCLLFMPVYFLLTFTVAAVLHYTVEKPFLILRDRPLFLPRPSSGPA